MEQTVVAAAPAGAEDPRSPRRRRLWLIPVGLVVFALLAVVLMVAHNEATQRPASTRPSNAIAVGETDGRSVAVVAYETDTFPHLDLFRIGSIGFSVQASAFDLATGERLWDTMLSNDYPSIGAEALAVGDAYAYVRTDEGLVILDAVTGAVVAREDGIEGLGKGSVASRTAYAYDAQTGQVVLRNRDDEVLGIPVGSDSARPVTADVALRWEGELVATEPDVFLYSETMDDVTIDAAPLPGPQPEPDPLTGIVPSSGMLRATWAPDEAWTADVVVDPVTGRAAGSELGFAVSEAHDGDGYTYQVAGLADGRARARLDIASGSGIHAVMVDPAGYVVMVVPNERDQALLVVATADSIRGSVIGERGWLGT